MSRLRSSAVLPVFFFLSTFLVEWHSLHAAVSFSFLEQTLPFSLKPGPRHCSFCSGSIFMLQLMLLGQTTVNDCTEETCLTTAQIESLRP